MSKSSTAVDPDLDLDPETFVTFVLTFCLVVAVGSFLVFCTSPSLCL